MPDVNSNQIDGLDVAVGIPAGTAWETWTFPGWVEWVGIFLPSGEGYWSRSASGAFSASGVAQHTIPAQAQLWVQLLPPRGGARVSTLRLAHSLGASGQFQFELLGAGRQPCL